MVLSNKGHYLFKNFSFLQLCGQRGWSGLPGYWAGQGLWRALHRRESRPEERTSLLAIYPGVREIVSNLKKDFEARERLHLLHVKYKVFSRTTLRRSKQYKNNNNAKNKIKNQNQLLWNKDRTSTCCMSMASVSINQLCSNQTNPISHYSSDSPGSYLYSYTPYSHSYTWELQ